MQMRYPFEHQSPQLFRIMRLWEAERIQHTWNWYLCEMSYRSLGEPRRHLTRISVVFSLVEKCVLAPEIKPKETANKVYPVEDLINERQKMLMATPKAQMTLRLITPTIEHRSGMHIRPTTEVPFNIEICDTSGFRATRTLKRSNSHNRRLFPYQCLATRHSTGWRIQGRTLQNLTGWP